MNNKGIPRIYKRQEKSILKESKRQGLEVIDVMYVDFKEEDRNNNVLNTAVKSILGGNLKVTYAQVFLFNKNGEKQIYIQPYAGQIALPGEHHIILSGGFSSPIVLKDQEMYGGPCWKCKNSKLENWVNKEETPLEKASKEVEFQWTVGTGKIDLEWGGQFYYIGEGKSHLIMQSGRYGGFITYKVGFKEFGQLVEALKNILEDKVYDEQQPIYKSHYINIVKKYINS
ncbi:hypothetical protein [Oceanirhabdus sp. W0125-5]|uniref:hypothetical protein n=1 Tax=Oceanirhabdus sp. W0125-5 TaxID=2999116 RepID=UPI0022F302AC|nr:hypothetical protein [Oceanirhabdus sp. W0125-5]WBW98386.1 hypothetical protein OW730_06355 [Oceanirhabdus sp. W0125-5]